MKLPEALAIASITTAIISALIVIGLIREKRRSRVLGPEMMIIYRVDGHLVDVTEEVREYLPKELIEKLQQKALEVIKIKYKKYEVRLRIVIALIAATIFIIQLIILLTLFDP
ncbi:MAG: hypothetical protein QXI22_03740 [Sulfolobales archaeon]